MIRRTTLSGYVLVATALAGLFVPLPAPMVERWFAAGAYPVIQPLLTFASNAVPFALLDVLVSATLLLFFARGLLDVRATTRFAAAVQIGHRLVVWSSAFYVAFLLGWGLNYRRVPLDRRLAFDRTRVTSDAAARLASSTVDRLNALHPRAHADGFGSAQTIDPMLASAFDRVARAIAVDRRFVAGRPKQSALDWYFQRAGVSGMTDPFFLETLIAEDLLPFERPFVIAHEWSHLAGLADEGEANLGGWITCLGGSASHQYSGWLFMYSESMRAVGGSERQTISARLLAGPRQDLQAIQARLARHVNPALSSAGWRVYDSYLKANRIEAGAASYEDVVRLALGLHVARKALEEQRP
jgi:hypothetical protein